VETKRKERRKNRYITRARKQKQRKSRELKLGGGGRGGGVWTEREKLSKGVGKGLKANTGAQLNGSVEVGFHQTAQ